MPESQAETLAEKYRNFNKVVNDATSDPNFNIKDINYDEPDIDNLIRIEIASRRKVTNFILDVFKCKDMLYAFRAIKLSAWLIHNDEYKHIINPDYIHKNLVPHMTLKAFNKLMTKIRTKLRDPKRVDEFFHYFKDKDIKRALKWLPHCSDDLAEEMLQKFYDDISLSTLEKFKSNSNCVYIYCKKNENDYNNISKALKILKVNNVERYFNLLFGLVDAWYHVDKLSAKSTKKLIKKSPHTTLNDFICFINVIHIPTLVKSFSGEEIKDVLIKHSRNKKYESLYRYDKLKYFVAHLPQEDKLDLIKNVFIGKEQPVYTNESDLRNSTMIRCLTNMNNAYLWCEYLPSDEAFKELKQFIEVESNPDKRSYMLCTLLSSTHKNYDHINTVLQYYVNSHLHEGFRFKTQFLQHLLHELDVLKLKVDSWNLLNILFYNIGVYSKIVNPFPEYKPNPFIIIGKRRRNYNKRVLQHDDIFVNCIILYNIINDIDIPEILLTKFKHTTYKEMKHRCNEEETFKLFEFLFKILKSKLDKEDLNIDNFEGKLLIIKNILQLFNDWNKNINQHPNVLSKIREFRNLCLREKYDCSELDSLVKSMKIALETEKSDILSAGLCMKILKTNPQDLINFFTKDDVSWKFNTKPMRRFLRILRCYWGDSIANELKSVSPVTSDRPNCDIPWGLSTEREILELVQTHFSTRETDCLKGSNVKFEIAKHLHLFRPCVSLKTTLDLCKENEMQYFVSSIHSLIYNMDPSEICNIFLKLQYLCSSRKKPFLLKHCLKVALKRLNGEEKANALKEIWKLADSKLSRFLVFQEALFLLREGTDKEIILDIWSVISHIIDDIRDSDTPSFIKLLINPNDVPEAIITDYCDKVQSLLKNLPDKTHFHEFNKKLILNPEEKIKELDVILNKKYFYPPYWLQDYILNTSDEKIQIERYEKLLVPLIDNDKFMLYEKPPIITLILSFYRDLDHKVLYNKAVVPVAVFTDIQRKLEDRLPFYENYVLITAGRLFLGYLRILDRNSKQITYPDDIIQQTQRDFGEFCADYLDAEIEKHFPTIYMSFSDALTFLFHSIDSEKNMRFIDAMINRNPRAECFLTIVHDLPRKTYRTPDDILLHGILKKIRTHPSEEVRILYSNYFIKSISL